MKTISYQTHIVELTIKNDKPTHDLFLNLMRSGGTPASVAGLCSDTIIKKKIYDMAPAAWVDFKPLQNVDFDYIATILKDSINEGA